MKTWLVCLFVMAALIGFGLRAQNGMEHQSANLIKALDQVQNRINSRQWLEATENLGQLVRKWDDTKPVWALFIHHQEIDMIDSAIIRLLRSVKSESFTDSQTASGELRHFLQHIPVREKFSLINIW
jgi:hypothetical protein